MDNRFFNRAFSQASSVAGKKHRLLGLATQLFAKLRTANISSIKQSDVLEKFYTLGRLSKAYALGHYRNIPTRTVVLIVAAIIYLINPIDLIPDLLPFGLSDDFAILAWVYSSIGEEIENFLTWERTTIIIQE